MRASSAEALARHGRLVYANSLGAEAMVLTDIIWSHLPQIDVFSIDTGRLHEETYELLERLQRRYQRSIRVVYPDAAALERLVAAQGVNGFYDSVEARLECCRIRKVEPFRRAIAGFPAWVTGVRREQSAGRARGQAVEWDAAARPVQGQPAARLERGAGVAVHPRARSLPYNALHDRQFPSIGCAPCTRADPARARAAAPGRWWWEQPESRECGLHPRSSPPPASLRRCRA